MSDSQPGRSLSPWWVLLILPAAPAVGWFVGQSPVPKRVEPPADVRPAAANVPSPAKARAGGTETGIIAVEVAQDPGSAPAPTPEPVREPPRQEFSSWTSFESAVAESQRNGKPVLIDFSADWCPPCQRMKQEVFQHGGHAQTVQTAVIPVAVIDRARENGSNPRDIEDLQQRYGVDAFPTLVVFSPATGRMVKTQGFGGAERTVEWITQAAQSVR